MPARPQPRRLSAARSRLSSPSHDGVDETVVGLSGEFTMVVDGIVLLIAIQKRHGPTPAPAVLESTSCGELVASTLTNSPEGGGPRARAGR